MALWLFRAGGHGEYEQKFLEEGRIYFTWSGLSRDMRAASELAEMYQLFAEVYPEEGKGKIQNWARQGSQFTHHMAKGDWVALPSKFNPVIHFGKITGEYEFSESAEEPYHHTRKVDWFAADIPRSRFDQDILHSLGAFLTVARIQRNNAEARIHEMATNGWQVPKNSAERIRLDGQPKARATASNPEAAEEPDVAIDLQEIARDQIAKLILAKYKGHGLARLVKAILEAEGYQTYMPPEGPDKGVDLLAAPDNLGFGQPRICVQVKATDNPIERVVLDQLIGVMQNFNAEKGLLVSWGGFKHTIERERATQFFRVRLWDRDDLLANLFKVYHQLPESIRSEIPLKPIWVTVQEE